ncbi:MAG: tetratricopeptide repeat protein [Prochlorotrichaceae cyanobacterium]
MIHLAFLRSCWSGFSAGQTLSSLVISVGLWCSGGLAFAQNIPASDPLDPLTQEALDRFNAGDLDASLEGLQRVLAQAQAAKDWQQVGETWNNIGLVQEQKPDPDAALVAYQSALEAYETLAQTGQAADIRTSKIGEAKTLNNLGGVYVGLQQPEAALGFLERSLVLLQEVQLPSEEATTLRNLGGLYAVLNRFADAIQATQDSLSIETELGNTTAQLITQERLAALYTQVGAAPQAISTLEDAVGLAQTLNNEDVEGILYSQIGEVKERSGDYQGAIAAYSDSLAIVENSQQPDVQVAVIDLLTRLGDLHSTLDQVDQGIDRYQQALERIPSETEPLLWGEVMVALGQLYLQQENWSAAEDTYSQALARIEPLNFPLAQAQLLRGLGTVYQAQDNLPQAVATLQQALTLAQSITPQDSVNAQVQQQEEGLTLNQLGDVYRQQQAYDQALTQYQAAYQALNTGQDRLGQGDTLRDIGVTHLLRNSPKDAIEPLLSAVQLWQFLSYQTGTVLDPSVEAHQLLQAALIRSEQPELALVSAEDERSFPLRISQLGELRARPPQPLSLEQIRSIVAEHNSPVIFYDLAAEPGDAVDESIAKLRIWIIASTGEITLRELTLSSLDINTPEDLLSLVNADPKDPQVLTQLANLLIVPISLELAALEETRVGLIIPPLFLSIPFADLPLNTPNGNDRPLGEQFEIELSPSILSLTLAPPQTEDPPQ